MAWSGTGEAGNNPMRGDRTALNTPDTAHSRAVAYLLAARALRDFGDGFVAVLLPVYLTALGFSPLEVGVIATAALLGSALLTLAIGLIGGRHDQRRLLIAGASLMVATGVAFASSTILQCFWSSRSPGRSIPRPEG